MMVSLYTGARILIAIVLASTALVAAGQQAYPIKPIRLVTPVAAGGSTDILARLLAQRLTESLGQQVFVDNRPGGNGIIGAEIVYRAAPDGYTLLLISSTHIITPLLVPTPYDALNDFAPVAGNASSALMLVVHPSLPAHNLREFIALARSKPGQLDYASTGAGSLAHLAGELFSMMAGIKMQAIPYKGGGPAISDLIGGHVQLYFAVPISIMPHIQARRVRPIALIGENRLAALPQVPTFKEAGLPGFDVRFWYGTLAPVGTPKHVIDRLASEIRKIQTSSTMKEMLLSQGMEPFVATPGELIALLKAETDKYAKVIKAANIKVDYCNLCNEQRQARTRSMPTRG